MKHFKKVVIVLAALLMLTQVAALADETAATPEVTPEPTPEAEVVETEEEITITPDSVLYPVKLMYESISISLAVDENNKAELLVKYANRRLLEAEIMQAEDNEELAQELVEESLDLIAQANDLLLGTEGEGATNVIVNIEQFQEEVLIRLSFMLAEGVEQEDIEKLIEKTEEEVIKTIITNAFLVSKDNFFDAKDDFFDAKDAYKAALESGDEEAIAQAYAKLLETEALKDELEAVKDEFDAYKDEIKDSFDDDDDDDDEDEDNNHGKNEEKLAEEINEILEKLGKYAQDDEEVAEFIETLEAALASQDADLDELLDEAEELLDKFEDNGKGNDKDKEKENNGKGNDKDKDDDHDDDDDDDHDDD